MGFVDAIKSGFRHRMNFAGRSSRSEFWSWVLFVILYIVVTMTIFLAMNISVAYATQGLIVVGFLDLFAIVPGIALIARRLHDLDRPGWQFLVVVAPVVGQVILLVWMCMRGTVGPNRFGPDPLAGGTSAIVVPAPAS